MCVTIEEDKFDDLIGKITNLIDEIRKWHAERTEKCVRFITVSHGVWDGKRKKQMVYRYISCIQEHLLFAETQFHLHLLW